MTLAVWFWVIFVIALIFIGVGFYRDRTTWPNLVVWVLLFLLGVGTFGSPIK